MVVLGIDTCTRWVNVSLVKDGLALAELSLKCDRRHAELLPVLCENLLASSSLKWHDLSLVAVTVGPGAFTGIKIGMSYAKSVAYGLDIPICGVNTLDAMVADIPIDKNCIVIPILWAKRQMVYFAVYSREKRIKDPQFSYVKDFCELLWKYKQNYKRCYLVGEDVRDLSCMLNDKDIVDFSSFRPSVRAINVALMAYLLRKQESVFDIEAYYMRQPDIKLKV